jgi:hypothetical protein
LAEIVEATIVAGNPSCEVLGFTESLFVEAVTVHVEAQFLQDNPVLAVPLVDTNRGPHGKGLM